MKLLLTSHDLKINKAKDGTFWYRLNKDIKVEGVPTRKLALKHAEELLKILFKNSIKYGNT